jgi:type IV secretion system protein VirD4
VFFNAFWGAFISLFIGLVLYSLGSSGFDLSDMDWRKIFVSFCRDGAYWATFLLIFVLFHALYYGFISRGELGFGKKGIRGNGKLGQIDANLENSRWMTDAERDKFFNSHKYSQLAEIKKDGVPMRAIFDGKKDLNLTFISPCHSLIIGSTGSGKTTTFINPMIQLLAATKAGSSMLITDPKGELFSLHSKFLAARGYDVKVLDLRDTYHSYRWNPLEPLWDTYQEYVDAPKNAFEREDDVTKSGLRMVEDASNYGDVWYEFDGKAFADFDRLLQEVKIFRARKFDEMYEDMNDLVSVLVPVQNQNDPMWEKGARSITMGVLLAMLEDSADPRLGMTKEKFNLFNASKILQNSNDEYRELREYFQGRDPLSKAVAVSKQVLDAPDKTRSSYMSVLLEKLSIFNDTGICALTSSSDFKTSDLAERPTALFVKIPDEKDTRHGLASIFLTNVYKSLIKVASSYEDLSLPRNVYYILDEFGNMPKIEKFDKMITVGRSRKIWFNMVVQSYVQLNNVYGDTVADIVKGNCGIKMFIGSNDMGTCKEYSELCGNVTVLTKSTSGNKKGGDVNVSESMQTRPLIYPSELQKLNNKFSSGNSLVVTFGNYPLKTQFTPSYKSPLYQMGKMDTDDIEGRLFEEEEVFYNIARRNSIVLGGQNETT